jgi:DNA-binding beta-propeller fold protein YncE
MSEGMKMNKRILQTIMNAILNFKLYLNVPRLVLGTQGSRPEERELDPADKAREVGSSGSTLKMAFITTILAQSAFASPLFNVTLNGSSLVITTTTQNQPYIAILKNLPPGFSLATPRLHCKSTSNGNCIVTVSDTKAATIALSGPTSHYSFQLCTTETTSPICEPYDIRFALIANRGVTIGGIKGTRQISVCPIINDTLAGGCTGQNPGAVLTDPISSVLNASGTMASVLNTLKNTITQCTLNHGTFVSCNTVGGPFYFGVTLAMGPTGSIYITNYASETVTRCPTNHQGEIIPEDCQESPSLFSKPTGIAINKSGTMAYVVNSAANTVSICSLYSSGLIKSCLEVDPNSTFSNPSTITMNADETFAYITNNGDQTLSVCPMVNGLLTACYAEPMNTLTRTWGFALNQSGTKAYMTDVVNNAVSICPITNGLIGPCTSIHDSTFGVITGITMSN